MRIILATLAGCAVLIGLMVGPYAFNQPTTMPVTPGGHAVQALRPVPDATQAFGYGATSVSGGSVIRAEVARIVCTSACLFEVSGNPTATASSAYLPANVVEFIRVVSGTDTVAVIRDTQNGTVYVTEMR